MKTIILLAVLLLLPNVALSGDGPSAPAEPAAPAAVDASHLIAQAIDAGVPLFNEGHVEQCAALYAAAALRLLAARDTLGAWDRADLRAALDAEGQDARAKAWALRGAFDRILANATFEPLMEAPLPKGFPKPGPVGRIVEKRYPVYRAARAEGGMTAFWTLFSHIKKNGVEMTAPVEMTMDGKNRMRDMAFLYERPDQGKAGTQGSVDVLDLSPVTVLSLGVRGRRGDGMVAKARALLERHMQAHGFERDGDFRVLGYNSPMVPAEKQYWEIQVPVSR